jgi:hypothetical protein
MDRKKQISLVDLIPLYKIGDGYAVAKDGSLTVGFRITLPELDNLNASDFVLKNSNSTGLNLNPVLQTSIKFLPDGYCYHQQDIQFYEAANLPVTGDYLSRATFRQYNETDILSAVTYIFISRRALIAAGQIDINKEIIREFEDTVKRFQIGINALHPERMMNDDWIFYLESFFARDFSKESETAKQIFDLSFKQYRFGDMALSGYAVTGDKNITDIFPMLENRERSSQISTKYTRYNSFVHPVTWKVPCYKIINNIIVKVPERTIKGNIREFANRVRFSIFKEMSKGADNFIRYMEENEVVPVYHHFNAFYVYDEKGQDTIEHKILAGFEDMGRLRPNKLTIDLDDVFLGTIGGCTSTLEYPYTLYPSFLHEAIAFCNFEGTYAQQKNGIIFSDTQKNPVVVDLDFEPFRLKQITNNNSLVVGPSGTGKSVSMNYLTASQLIAGYFNFIIDIGSSYRGLCKLFGGKFIEMDREGKNLQCNPFLVPLIDPDNDLGGYLKAEIEVIISLLFVAWDSEENLNIKNSETTQVLEDLLNDFYKKRFLEKQEFVCFDDFYNYIESRQKEGKINTGFFPVDSFLLVMKKYRKSGSYGYLFNGNENLLDFEKYSLVVFELEKIEGNKVLFKLVLSLLMVLAKRVLERSKAPMKKFRLDECWRFLLLPFFGEFIMYQFKTIRKKGAGIEIIVQEVDDILKTEYASAILTNSDTLMILSHEGKETSITKHQQLLSLTDDEMSKILSMKKSAHEIYIRLGTYSKIYGVNLSLEHYALFTTTGKERDYVHHLIEKNDGNIPGTIDQIVGAGGITKIINQNMN